MKRVLTLAFAGVMAATTPAMAGSYVLTTGNDYKPFTDESLPNGGMITEIARKAYKQDGHQVEIKFMPWKRGARLAQKGDVTATFPYIRSPSREKKWHFSDPVYVSQDRPFVKAGSDTSIESVSDLEGLKGCNPVGWTTPSYVEDLVEQGKMKLASPNSLVQCARLLNAGRIDVVTMDVPSFKTAVNDAFGSMEKFRMLDLVLAETPNYVVFPKGVSGVKKDIEVFNSALAKLKKSGEHGAIVEKHLN